MDLLSMSLKAGLPVIAVSTEDTLNAKLVLETLVGQSVVELSEKVTLDKTTEKYCMAWDYEGSIDDLYSFMIEVERTVVLVNCPKENPLIFQAGVLPVPQELIIKHLSAVVDGQDVVRLLPALGGLTLKEISEIGRMAMANYGELSSKAVMKIRKQLMSRLRGIFQVDTDMEFYYPVKELDDWLAVNGELFLHCDEQRLVPRGLLFDGKPGVGKTAAAKYLANQLQVPLWMMDLGATMNKYVGQSEQQLALNLQQIDSEAPGVLLFDEVEKVFKSQGDEGVTTRMLSKLLWWLQEHRSKILTVMTTNDMKAIPPELHREGRIDATMTFKGLKWKDRMDFVKSLVASFVHIPVVGEHELWVLGKVATACDMAQKEGLTVHTDGNVYITQAFLTQCTYNAVKEIITKTQNKEVVA